MEVWKRSLLVDIQQWESGCRGLRLLLTILWIAVALISTGGAAFGYDVVYTSDDTYVCGALSNGYASCEAQNYDNDFLRVAYISGSYFYSSFIKFPYDSISSYCNPQLSRVELVLTAHSFPTSPSVTVVRFRHLGGWDWDKSSLTAQLIQDYINTWGWNTVRDFITTLTNIQNPTVIDITSQFQSTCTEGTPLTIALEGDYSGTDYSFAWWDRESGGISQGPFLRIYQSAPPMPDLWVEAQPDTIHTGVCGSTLPLQVINSGDADAGAFTLKVTLDGVTWFDTMFQNLAAGDTQLVEIPVYTITGGHHVLVAKVDTANAVPESNEANNETQVSIVSVSRYVTYPFTVFSGGEADPDGIVDFLMVGIESIDSFRTYYSDSIQGLRDVPVADMDYNDHILFIPSQRDSNNQGTFQVFLVGSNQLSGPIFTDVFPYIHTVFYDANADSVWVSGKQNDSAYVRIYASANPFPSTYREVRIAAVGQITELLIDDNLTPGYRNDDTVYISGVFGSFSEYSWVKKFPITAANDGYVSTSELINVALDSDPNQDNFEVFTNLEGGVLYGKAHHITSTISLYSPCDPSNPVVTLNLSNSIRFHGLIGLDRSGNAGKRFLVSGGSFGLYLMEDGPTDMVIQRDSTAKTLLLRASLQTSVSVHEKPELKISAKTRFVRAWSPVMLPKGKWHVLSPEGRTRVIESGKTLYLAPGHYLLKTQGKTIRLIVVP